MLAVIFLLPYVDRMTTVEVLRHLFGPLSMSNWPDDFPDSIREGRVGRAMRADLVALAVNLDPQISGLDLNPVAVTRDGRLVILDASIAVQS